MIMSVCMKITVYVAGKFCRRKFSQRVLKFGISAENFYVCNFAHNIEEYRAIMKQNVHREFLQIAVYPQNLQKCSPSKISCYTVYKPERATHFAKTPSKLQSVDYIAHSLAAEVATCMHSPL